jgi:hypothetical protein
MFPQYSTGMSLINPNDVKGLLGAALPSGLRNDMMDMAGNAIDQYRNLGMNTGVMQGAQAMPNQYPGSGQEMADKMIAADESKRNMDAMRMMAAGIQGMGRNQMTMPSGNTAQIIRDSNQFRFAGTPQQQMANALRNR